jgi:hypothetical protein
MYLLDILVPFLFSHASILETFEETSAVHLTEYIIEVRNALGKQLKTLVTRVHSHAELKELICSQSFLQN